LYHFVPNIPQLSTGQSHEYRQVGGESNEDMKVIFDCEIAIAIRVISDIF